MAIFDSEKRPRGLRVPSLTAMKNGSAASKAQFPFQSKKSHGSKTADEQPVRAPVPSAATVAVATPRPSPPQKDLPPPPKETLPPPPRMSSRKVPPRREVSANANTAANPNHSPVAPQPVRPVKSPIVSAPPSHSESQSQSPPVTVPPVTLSPPPEPAGEVETDYVTPLEDFIPTPEGASTPLESCSRSEQPSPSASLELGSVAAPLDKVHFACYQEHRSMPVAQNIWHPLPCMTCLKLNREIRYRCVFCCLRICGDCHQLLQKCQNRSLTELMSKLR